MTDRLPGDSIAATADCAEVDAVTPQRYRVLRCTTFPGFKGEIGEHVLTSERYLKIRFTNGVSMWFLPSSLELVVPTAEALVERFRNVTRVRSIDPEFYEGRCGDLVRVAYTNDREYFPSGVSVRLRFDGDVSESIADAGDVVAEEGI
jgi:hypothetical protein